MQTLRFLRADATAHRRLRKDADVQRIGEHFDVDPHVAMHISDDPSVTLLARRVEEFELLGRGTRYLEYARIAREEFAVVRTDGERRIVVRATVVDELDAGIFERLRDLADALRE